MTQRFSTLLALLALVSLDARAQATLTGTVREDSTGRALQDVEIIIEGQSSSTRSDSAGRYTLRAPPGAHVALFRAVGFRPARIHVTLTSNQTTTADAVLVSQPAHELAAVDVKARPVPRSVREGFHERKTSGFGRAMDRLGNCYVAVILDGQIIYRSGSPLPPPDFSREFPVMSLDAVEYYGNPSRIPAELSMRAGGCGALVLWTRRAH